MMRLLIAKLLLKLGMALLPKDVRDMVRDLLMYHVPGAVSEERKAEIRASKMAIMR